ncbi:YEATS-associated helix-containing protein [Paenibacillus taiwanensis]|uniref:YEATS-associated helix-containing protein n=1 Tax=Paenibacillus taiwanensis TaxID=401638 RepID=UPI00041DAD82|nr:YEATS-associated helix-containing protein [Paenibacillus taiwanensis]
MSHGLTLFLIMLAAGIMGGGVNYLIVGKYETVYYKDRMLYKAVFVGIAASFLVPLFLNTISSNLLLESKQDGTQLFVFAGFCLIASISSNRFIKSVSDKFMQQLHDVQHQVDHVKQDVEALTEKNTEAEDSVVSADPYEIRMLHRGTLSDAIQLEQSPVLHADPSLKVLQALQEGDYVFRTVTGICKETELEESCILRILQEQIQLGNVVRTEREAGIRYHITPAGRKYTAHHDQLRMDGLSQKEEQIS